MTSRGPLYGNWLQKSDNNVGHPYGLHKKLHTLLKDVTIS